LLAEIGPAIGTVTRPDAALRLTIVPPATRRRGTRACDRDLAEDVDLELARQGVDRHELKRSLDDDRGVVDQCPMEPYWSEKIQPPRRRS
jgi:hypothetical protein